MMLPSSEKISIRLHFDTFFVRKNLVNSDDERQLVVRAPTLVELL